jgi:hypothetical protein
LLSLSDAGGTVDKKGPVHPRSLEFFDCAGP